MTDATFLRANVAAISPLITDPDTNPFLPQAPHACSDFLRDTRIIQAASGSNHQHQYIHFHITKTASSLFRMYLRCRRPAIAVPTGLTPNATFLRWVDGVAISEIADFRIHYGSTDILRYSADYILRRIKNTLEPNRLEAYENCTLLNKTDAVRSQLTQQGCTTFLPVMLPSGFDVSQSMPIIQNAQIMHVTFEVRPLRQVLNCDSSVYQPDATVNCIFDLYCDYYILTEPENAFLTSKSQTDDGIAYLNSNRMIVQHNQVQVLNTITAATDVDITLLTKGCVKEFEFWMTPVQLKSTDLGNDFWVTSNNPIPIPSPNGAPAMGPYGEISSWGITCSGTDCVRKAIMTNGGILWNKNLYFKDYHTGRPGENRYGWSWSLAPEMENAALGNLAFSNLSTPTLTLTFPPNNTLGLPGGTGVNPVSGLNQTLDVTILYYTYGYTQWQGGDINEVFT